MAVILFIFIIFPCHCAVNMYKIMILQKPIATKFCIDPIVEMWLIVYSNDYAPLTVRPIYSSSNLRTAQMMIFSLVAMIGLEKCCITSAYLQWLCHSGERAVAHGPLVSFNPADQNLRHVPSDVCYQQRLWSAGAFAQSNQNFHWMQSSACGLQNVIRLRRCAGWCQTARMRRLMWVLFGCLIRW